MARDLNTGKEKVIVPLTSTIHTSLRIDGDRLYYGVFEIKGDYKGSPFSGFGLISSVYEKNLFFDLFHI